jgi:hypothetical protein
MIFRNAALGFNTCPNFEALNKIAYLDKPQDVF